MTPVRAASPATPYSTSCRHRFSTSRELPRRVGHNTSLLISLAAHGADIVERILKAVYDYSHDSAYLIDYFAITHI